jgi:hypothetical protein
LPAEAEKRTGVGEWTGSVVVGNTGPVCR